ncbi:MAG: M3 family metallopeptidase [Bacteroidia bacterium]|nr:M3 family metallopeptidase [Bacteroidia bacterium]MBT8276287.1 M3 family metallopeptidase [Bacteroidia bacterium]NNF30620.1 M3 family metallopeptidase [Flavobacteriaceae bacterium]NNK53180.1 M3 family metallopeptidase [Flavobacteriaceae bacterium]NNM09394.1 M3 family metallopeptidase [Flavobacteriaceae bacterium]
MNPLLKKFTTAPFSKINNEHYLPAFKDLIQHTKVEIDAIVINDEKPGFKNTIEALERTGEQLDRVSSIFFNLNSAETNDEIQKIAQEVSPLLTNFNNDLLLNEALFKKVKAVHDSKDELELSHEQAMLLDKQYKAFARNGANLKEADKLKLREIDAELSKLTLKFGENVLAETNVYELHLTSEEDLKGLPDGAKEAAAHIAKDRGKEGWVITLDYPSYIPFMKYADNRKLRKQLSLAFGSRAFKNNDHNNETNVLRIANLRHQRALLLGYDSHAHFVLEERMAETPQKVTSFLNELMEKAKPAALQEFNELEQFAKELDGIDELQKWDSAYYAEKLKQKLFDLDDEKLKPYFELEKVIAGVFSVANKLYGLNFTETKKVDVYHEEVKTYEVTDAEGAFVSLFYADFHPRPGKRNGAWMTSYRSQQIKNEVNDRPHISIVCNFTKPTPSKPSLLTFNEVTTLFHEFGHALHGMLANTTYSGLSGTSVYWDFVELPSQILENWCYEKETLELFAKHYKTDELIPMEYVEKIKDSSTFHEGMQTLRQLSFGLLDMAWHGADPSEIENVKAFESKTFESTRLYPDTPETCMSTSFSHIFQGGYSAGYYSYKWAEVLDADAFEYFQQEGIFNKTVATKFKDYVLSKGGTQDPMELYVKFRGQKPNPDALLKRAGLLKN